MWIRVLIAIVFLLTAVPCLAATHYILDGGSGDGSAWNNALDDLPAALTRGDTYYIGDGTYAAYTFDDATSGTNLITIKKATTADHGTETGWSSTYGDGEAVFYSAGTTWTISSDYYVIDGQSGSGKDPGGYGIRVYTTASRGTTATLVNASGADHVTISHVEFDFNNGSAASSTAATRMWGCWGVCDTITIESCYFHHSTGYVFYLGSYGTPAHTQTNYVIDHCYFDTIGGGGSIASGHWELMWLLWATNFQFRYNTIENVFETLPTYNGQTGWLMMGGSTNTQIYGNLFFCSDEDYCDVGGNGVIATWSNDVYVNAGVYIYNNTFVDITSRDYAPKIYFYHNTANDTNVTVRNNLYYNSEWSWTGVDTQTHEACGGGQSCSGTDQQTGILSGQFSNYAGDVFTLAYGTTAGVTLDSPYNVDINGNNRGADGTWDRGAYEYGTEGNPTTVTITTNSGANYDTNSSTVTIAGTASDGDGVDHVAYSTNRSESGACTGTTEWSCANIPMHNGMDVVTITAYDVGAGTGTDSITVTYYEAVADETTLTISGVGLVYIYPTAADYKILGSVNAPNTWTNSFYIDIDNDPAADETKGWHLDVTSGYETQYARWGTFEQPDLYESPKIWTLTQANHIVYIREREASTLIQSIKFYEDSAVTPGPFSVYVPVPGGMPIIGVTGGLVIQ